MQFCELPIIRQRIGLTVSDHDVLLTRFSEWASAMFDQHCHRNFERQEADTYEVAGDRCEISLPHYPIEWVIGFYLRDSGSAPWVMQQDVTYHKVAGGVISLPYGPLGTKYQRLRVMYTGGYVLPGTTVQSGQTALPDDVENACAEQVSYWFEHRHAMRLTETTGESAAARQMRELTLLPAVAKTLEPYQRMIL